jgi:hypothetical protein
MDCFLPGARSQLFSMKTSTAIVPRRRRALLLSILMVVGCSNGQGYVTGLVTLDGKPVEASRERNGTVSFYRESGGGAPAIGIIDQSGRYTLKNGGAGGIEPGNYLVGVAIKELTQPTNGVDMPSVKLISPAKYSDVGQSGLKAEVKLGNNTFDIALQSK